MSDNKSNLSWPLILIVIIIIMVMTVGTSYLMVFLFNGNNPGSGTAKVTDDPKKEVSKLGPTYALGEFTVNLATGRSMARTEMYLEVENDDQLKELQERQVQLKDAVLTILRSKNYEDVKIDLHPLKVEIMQTINNFLAKGKVKNVYITDFIIH